LLHGARKTPGLREYWPLDAASRAEDCLGKPSFQGNNPEKLFRWHLSS
jgi:hypothetical protein